MLGSGSPLMPTPGCIKAPTHAVRISVNVNTQPSKFERPYNVCELASSMDSIAILLYSKALWTKERQPKLCNGDRLLQVHSILHAANCNVEAE